MRFAYPAWAAHRKFLVGRLADNGWLHLFRIDAEAGWIWRYHTAGWRAEPPGGAPPRCLRRAAAAEPGRADGALQAARITP